VYSPQVLEKNDKALTTAKREFEALLEK